MELRTGIIKLSITAMLFAGMGIISPQTAFADDVPLPPTTFRANDGADRYTFTWSKVGRTGANGGAVNPDNVTYVLEALDENYNRQRELVVDKVQNYTLFYPTTQGEQDIMRFGLYARNSAGKSAYTYLKVVTGAPYNLPYRESFATGATRGLCWQEGDGTFVPTTEDSADDDLGALLCIPAGDGSASSFNLGKIVMEYALNPRLSFRMTGLGEGEKLAVRISRPDGQEATMLTVKGPVDDWTLYTVDLSSIGRQKYIIPKFQLAEGNENLIALDDIKIEDPYTSDLGVRVRPGNTSAENPTVRVLVENEGLTACREAAVALYVDGEFTTRQYLDEELAPGENTVMEIRVPVRDTEPKEVKAMAEWPYDLNPYNDTATTQFVMDEPLQNELTAVGEIRDLEGSEVEVYSIDGRRIAVASISELKPGIYVANGKKFIVREQNR